jgi:hypothetical protein
VARQIGLLVRNKLATEASKRKWTKSVLETSGLADENPLEDWGRIEDTDDDIAREQCAYKTLQVYHCPEDDSENPYCGQELASADLPTQLESTAASPDPLKETPDKFINARIGRGFENRGEAYGPDLYLLNRNLSEEATPTLMDEQATPTTTTTASGQPSSSQKTSIKPVKSGQKAQKGIIGIVDDPIVVKRGGRHGYN